MRIRSARHRLRKSPALPIRAIPRAAVGVGLPVHLFVRKYAGHILLNRQERIAAWVGVEPCRQKLCRWVEEAALQLRTSHDRLHERILADRHVQLDETPVNVLEPDRGTQSWPTYGRICLRCRKRLSSTSISRVAAGTCASSLHQSVRRLQSEGYDAYDRLVRDRPHLVDADCDAMDEESDWPS